MVINEVRESTGAFGYNVATGKYEDLVLAGVIDPTKVVRVALQNAASVASLMLTTEAMIAERPKQEAGAAGGYARRRHGRHGHVGGACIEASIIRASPSGRRPWGGRSQDTCLVRAASTPPCGVRKSPFFAKCERVSGAINVWSIA